MIFLFNPEFNFSSLVSVTANEKKSALPLNNPNPLQAMIGAGSKEKVTPQQALIQTMAAMHAKVRLIASKIYLFLHLTSSTPRSTSVILDPYVDLVTPSVPVRFFSVVLIVLV